PEGSTVGVDSVVAEINTDAKAPASRGRQPPDSAKPAAPSPGPAATRLLAESGLKAGDVPGTAPGGRVTKGDVLAAQESGTKKEEPVPSARPESRNSKPETRFTRQPMSQIRKRIAERLLESQNQTATLTTFNEADMSAIQELRA